jgi:hypothetical protein
MPQFNIHWKGCPHRHLPRIRVASPHYGTVCSRHFAHIAALEAGQLPYSLALQRARVQQRIRIRRGKHRARGSLGGIIALRQTSQRAMPNIQTLGLESPQEDIASKEQGNKDLEVPLFTDRLWTSPLRLSDDLVHSAESCCSSPSLITDRRDDLASSIDAVELAQCIDFQLSEGRDRQRGALNRRVGGKHDHVVSNDKVRKTSIYGRTPVLGRSRTYDPSIPIRRARRRTKSTSSKPDHQCQSRSVSIMLKRAAMDKQPSSTNRSAQQATIGSISSASTGSNSQPAQLSGLPSRTPAQLVALKHFGRELERHLIAQEAVRKACLHPSSPSSSTLSANTVVEFIPYMTEFQAAGLAVTSTEQRRPAIRQPRQEVAPLLPKDAGDKEQTPANASEGISNGSPITSHDGSGGGLYTDTTSSRTTLIEFSSYSEPNSAVAYPTGNVISKKSLLPWLRKPQEPSSLNQSIPVNSFDVYNDMRSSSTSTCETCATTIIEFSPLPMESESKQTEPGKWASGGCL